MCPECAKANGIDDPPNGPPNVENIKKHFPALLRKPGGGEQI
jgi:hypothetical protein